MARSPSPASKVPCAAAFDSHPSDQALIKSYLRPRHASGHKAEAGAGAFIHEADLYAAEPADLAREFPPAVAQDGGRAWYFLTPLRPKNRLGRRKARAVAAGGGWWHGEAGPKAVVDDLAERRQVGHRQSFSFMRREGGVAVRTGWLMVELRLYDDHRGHGHGGEQEEGSAGNLVLCKVYRSPRHPEPSDGKPTAAAAVLAPGREAAGDEESRRRHRKADDGEVSAGAATAARGEDDSAETSAAAPARKRKTAGGERSGAASAARPARRSNADGSSSGVHCPQCGFHFHRDAPPAAVTPAGSKSETGIAVQVDAPHGGEAGDSSVKEHSFHHLF